MSKFISTNPAKNHEVIDSVNVSTFQEIRQKVVSAQKAKTKPASAKASAGRDLFLSPSQTPYQQYVFMKDEKMLKVLEIDYEKNKVKVDLSKLYSSIDIAETLSNLTGKWIKRIQNAKIKNQNDKSKFKNNLIRNNLIVEFEDGTKMNTKDLDYKLIKPMVWWEEMGIDNQFVL